MTAEHYQQAEQRLVLVAKSHKSQVRFFRTQARETMEKLRVLRERMALLGIPVEVVKPK